VTGGHPDVTRDPGQGGAAGSPAGEPAARFADVCARRGVVYEALALGLGRPTEAYVATLGSGELTAGLREAVSWLGDDAARYEIAFDSLTRAGAAVFAAGMDAAHGALRVEHARLFTGPGRSAVRCYASQYLDANTRADRVNTAAADFAAAAYRSEGVAPAEACGELPDHVTLELEFLYHLCRREEAAWEQGDAAEARRLRRVFDAFLRDHAASWLPEFARELRATGEGGLYIALAELLETHLATEQGAVDADGVDPAWRRS